MNIERLDHVNIRTAQLAAVIEFYEKVIGLRVGPRPGLASTGAWLYLGERDILHLIASPTAQLSSEPQLEHFALRATGYQEFIARLDEHGIPYRGNTLTGAGLRQLHLHDPDGNHLELNFLIDDN